MPAFCRNNGRTCRTVDRPGGEDPVGPVWRRTGRLTRSRLPARLGFIHIQESPNMRWRCIVRILGMAVALASSAHQTHGQLGAMAAHASIRPGTHGVYDVREFGATANGITLNTVAIQKAIDACHAQGGGRVLICGGVYLTGAVRLRSNVILHVEAGARLLGSSRSDDYAIAARAVDWNQRMALIGSA